MISGFGRKIFWRTGPWEARRRVELRLAYPRMGWSFLHQAQSSPARVAKNHRVLGNGPCDDRAIGDEGVVTDAHAFENFHVRADQNVLANLDLGAFADAVRAAVGMEIVEIRIDDFAVRAEHRPFGDENAGAVTNKNDIVVKPNAIFDSDNR